MAHWGTGFNIYTRERKGLEEKLSVGFNVGYMFGRKDFTSRRSLINDTVLYAQANYETLTNYSNLVFSAGIQYRIPVDSPLGQEIAKSQVGIAVHTFMEDPHAAEQFIGNPQSKLKKVPGLLVTGATVDNLENLKLNRKLMSELSSYARGENAQALQGLLNPADLRAAQITDLPALMEKFIHSLKGTDYSGATPQAFGE